MRVSNFCSLVLLWCLRVFVVKPFFENLCEVGRFRRLVVQRRSEGWERGRPVRRFRLPWVKSRPWTEGRTSAFVWSRRAAVWRKGALIHDRSITFPLLLCFLKHSGFSLNTSPGATPSEVPHRGAGAVTTMCSLARPSSQPAPFCSRRHNDIPKRLYQLTIISQYVIITRRAFSSGLGRWAGSVAGL
jgi:hypothetical protein